MRIQKNGQPIITLDDWLTLGGPKMGNKHWQIGRSAQECARIWLKALPHGIPTEIATLLSGHSDFGMITYTEAEPEARLRFDTLKGEVRNADLVVTANDERGPIALTVEAKADETYGETVPNALAAAIERRLENERSCGVKRIEQLVAALLRPREKSWPSIRDIRYQLLTATAGTLALASRIGADRAVLVIQEFHTNITNDKNHRSNALDLDKFIHRISAGVYSNCKVNNLLGPFVVPGTPLFPAPAKLYIGKVVHNLRG